MREIFFGLTLSAMLSALCFPVEAQQTRKVYRIGFLTGSTPYSTRNNAFRQALRELGYVEGKNIVIEWRSHKGDRSRQLALAAELAGLNLDVIAAGGPSDIRAVEEATSTIPIVMVNGGDAVGAGFVASLAHPGGNLTGLTTLRPELDGKRLEVLKEIIPDLSRVAVFASSVSADYAEVVEQLGRAAEASRVEIQYIDVEAPQQFETAFQTAVKGRAEAVLFQVPNPVLRLRRTEVIQLAAKDRLPTGYENAGYAEAGGLMSYGLNRVDLGRRAAFYVDKILKGAKPAELPVEQPMKFELVINLKTAKQISLKIPPEVLMRADRVIH